MKTTMNIRNLFQDPSQTGGGSTTSTSEVGHTKNVANFQTLISYCTGYGVTYNPSLAAIKLANMNTLYTNAQAALTAVSNKYTLYKNAVNARQVLFLPMKSFATRIIAALIASGASAQTIKNAKAINRKIQGKRAKTIVPPDPNVDTGGVSAEKQANPNPIPIVIPINISVSQQSFDNLIQHFSDLINLLAAEPLYLPNEVDLKLAALNTLLANLKAVNLTAINAIRDLSNSRISRNKLLYLKVTGLCDIAEECKSYVRSIFGATSQEYAQVKAIMFRKQKI